jgi:hypothetical protein
MEGIALEQSSNISWIDEIAIVVVIVLIIWLLLRT